MDLIVQFGDPQNITPSDLDGVVVRYPFTVTYPGKDARKDKVVQHQIDVWISGTLYSMWGFGRFFLQHQPMEAIKTLFQFAKEEVVSKLKSGTLKDHEEIKLFTSSELKENPYDVEKIKYPSEPSFVVSVENSTAKKRKATEFTDWNDLIKKGENNFVEFKSSLRYCYREEKKMDYIEKAIAKTINAFLNSEGGNLFIGVDDNGNILGLDNDFKTFGKNNSKDRFLLKFDNIIRDYLGNENITDIEGQFIQVENREIFWVKVQPSSRPVFMKGGSNEEFYVRGSASSQPYEMREALDYIERHWS